MGKNHANVDPYVVSRVRALESLLLEKGILAPDAVDRVVERYESDTGPMVGRARGGAARGPTRATGACSSRTRRRRWPPSASTTRCSSWSRTRPTSTTSSSAPCARATPGRPRLAADVVQDAAYRSRASASRASSSASWGSTSRPRAELRVWDSSAEMRYMVLAAAACRHRAARRDRPRPPRHRRRR
jgi:nitrile hydratase